MKARPTWVRKVYAGLAVVVAAGLLATGYCYSQLTAEVQPDGIARPNFLEAKEAERKLDLYREAQKIDRPGFVRLSEVEINSYLQERYFSGSKAPQAAAAEDGSVHLDRSQVMLTDRSITWFCWIRKNWLGRARQLTWQRTFDVIPGADGRWAFQMTAMNVGRLSVPKSLWPAIEARLGQVDNLFTNQFHWFAGLPTLEIKTNVLSSKAELRLFTYRVTETR